MTISLRFKIGAIGIVIFGLNALQPADAEEEYVPDATVTTLHQDVIPGVDGKEMVIKHLAIAPEFVGGRHIHTGPVYVYVLEGELTVDVAGEVTTYRAGALLPEPMGTEMVGSNASSSDDLEILVIQVSDIGDPMMIKVE
jgi:quercetin dioxygenase-like cupin family protein